MNDQSLIHLLKADPEEGLRMTISLYGKAIKTICSSILRDAPDKDIEEAVSDTFVAIWQSARNFRMDQGISFKSYCYGISRKKALTRRKTLLLDTNLIPLEENILFPQDTIADEHERYEEERILHEIIFALKEPQRSVCSIEIDPSELETTRKILPYSDEKRLSPAEEERIFQNVCQKLQLSPEKKRKHFSRKRMGIFLAAATFLLSITVGAAEYFHLNPEFLQYFHAVSENERQTLKDMAALPSGPDNASPTVNGHGVSICADQTISDGQYLYFCLVLSLTVPAAILSAINMSDRKTGNSLPEANSTL